MESDAERGRVEMVDNHYLVTIPACFLAPVQQMLFPPVFNIVIKHRAHFDCDLGFVVVQKRRHQNLKTKMTKEVVVTCIKISGDCIANAKSMAEVGKSLR